MVIFALFSPAMFSVPPFQTSCDHLKFVTLPIFTHAYSNFAGITVGSEAGAVHTC